MRRPTALRTLPAAYWEKELGRSQMRRRSRVAVYASTFVALPETATSYNLLGRLCRGARWVPSRRSLLLHNSGFRLETGRKDILLDTMNDVLPWNHRLLFFSMTSSCEYLVLLTVYVYTPRFTRWPFSYLLSALPLLLDALFPAFRISHTHART